MFARYSIRTQILKKPTRFLQFTERLCSMSTGNEGDKFKVDVAGKVVAKDPPIKELTHGHKCTKDFDIQMDAHENETTECPKECTTSPPQEQTECERSESPDKTKKVSEKKKARSGEDKSDSANKIERERKRIEESIQLLKKQVAQLILDTGDDEKPGDKKIEKKPIAISPEPDTGLAKKSAVTGSRTGGSGSGSIGVIPPDAPRIQRSEPGETFFCLIPAEWVKAFNEKTGVTGFWTFAFAYGTYLLSKEKLVMEHEYYGGLSHIVLWWLTVKYVGPGISASIDKNIDLYEASFQKGRDDEKHGLNTSIEYEEKLQDSMDGQGTLVEAKRENVDLQLEAEYRQRLSTVYQRTVNILNYHVEMEEIKRRLAHKNITQWVINEVHKSLTDELHNAYMNQCFVELGSLLQAKGT